MFRAPRNIIAIAILMVLGAVGGAVYLDGPASGEPRVAPAPLVAAPAGFILGHVPRASAPTSASVVIGAGAPAAGYQTKVVTISRGGVLNVVNLDDIEHTVTSVARDAQGTPVFETFVEPGSTAAIAAASKLAAGTYRFYCVFHPTMRGTLIVEGSPGGGVHPVATKFEQPLRTPPVLRGANLHITMKRVAVRVLPHGPKTMMWTYGGTYPGPTIIRPAGHLTKVQFINHLPKAAGAVTVHLHGDHHSSANDGQPDSYPIRHGRHRTYTYPLTNNGKPETEAFDFYHDHRMNETGRNNWNGLQGMFIITDKREAALRLPTGRYDVPLLVSDRTFVGNQLAHPFRSQTRSMTGGMTGPLAPPGDATVGNRVLVDGRVTPYLDVAAHRYRFRLLNASNFESYAFALSDGRPFIQIGTGNSLLPRAIVRQNILLGPSQRADVIVDFHGALHKKIVLQSIPRTDSAPRGIGTPSVSIMQFRVTHRAPDATRLPSRLERPPALKAPKKPSMTWTFALGGNAKTGTYWTINGKPFDAHRVDARVLLGSTQTWLLRNGSPITHYIHLHEEQWHTIARDGKRPPPWERGLDDTWRLDPGETVEVAAKFTDYTGVFMIHCHMLNHEDDGMMAQFAVVRSRSSRLPAGYTLRSASSLATSSMSSMASSKMGMSMPMSPGAAVASMTRTDPTMRSASGFTLSGLMTRGGKILALELLVLAFILALRGYWRPYRAPFAVPRPLSACSADTSGARMARKVTSRRNRKPSDS